MKKTEIRQGKENEVLCKQCSALSIKGIDLALEHRATIDYNDGEPLMDVITSKGSNYEKKLIIDHLIKRGININIRNGVALTCAVQESNFELVLFLISRMRNGANQDDGMPVFYAAQRGQKEILKLLLQHGAQQPTDKEIIDCLSQEAKKLLCEIQQTIKRETLSSQLSADEATAVALQKDWEQDMRLDNQLTAEPGKGQDNLMIQVIMTKWKVNEGYQYEDIDMYKILELRMQQERQEGFENVFSIPPISDGRGNQLLTHLREEHELHQDSPNRTVLIPYNLGNYHWVGIVVRIISNQVVAVEYYDSLNGEIDLQVTKEIQGYYGISPTKIECLMQSDQTSCGPIAIENLINAARQYVIEGIAESFIIRAQHILLMENFAPESLFGARQYYNLPFLSSKEFTQGMVSEQKTDLLQHYQGDSGEPIDWWTLEDIGRQYYNRNNIPKFDKESLLGFILEAIKIIEKDNTSEGWIGISNNIIQAIAACARALQLNYDDFINENKGIPWDTLANLGNLINHTPDRASSVGFAGVMMCSRMYYETMATYKFVKRTIINDLVELKEVFEELVEFDSFKQKTSVAVNVAALDLYFTERVDLTMLQNFVEKNKLGSLGSPEGRAVFLRDIAFIGEIFSQLPELSRADFKADLVNFCRTIRGAVSHQEDESHHSSRFKPIIDWLNAFIEGRGSTVPKEILKTRVADLLNNNIEFYRILSERLKAALIKINLFQSEKSRFLGYDSEGNAWQDSQIKMCDELEINEARLILFKQNIANKPSNKIDMLFYQIKSGDLSLIRELIYNTKHNRDLSLVEVIMYYIQKLEKEKSPDDLKECEDYQLIKKGLIQKMEFCADFLAKHRLQYLEEQSKESTKQNKIFLSEYQKSLERGKCCLPSDRIPHLNNLAIQNKKSTCVGEKIAILDNIVDMFTHVFQFREQAKVDFTHKTTQLGFGALRIGKKDSNPHSVREYYQIVMGSYIRALLEDKDFGKFLESFDKQLYDTLKKQQVGRGYLSHNTRLDLGKGQEALEAHSSSLYGSYINNMLEIIPNLIFLKFALANDRDVTKFRSELEIQKQFYNRFFHDSKSEAFEKFEAKILRLIKEINPLSKIDDQWLAGDQISSIGNALHTNPALTFIPTINAYLPADHHGSIEQLINANIGNSNPIAAIINLAPDVAGNSKKGNHWILYFSLRNEHGNVHGVLLNPMGNHFYDLNMQQLQSQIQATYAHHNIQANIQFHNLGVQHDSHNCGVWALHFLEHVTTLMPVLREIQNTEGAKELLRSLIQQLSTNTVDIEAKRAEYIGISEAAHASQSAPTVAMDLDDSKNAAEDQDDIDEDTVGSGLYSSTEKSYWYEYSRSGIDELLNLRLKGLNLKRDIKVIKSSYIWNSSVKSAELLALRILQEVEDNTITLLPVNIHKKHWAGLVFEKSGNRMNIKYLDSSKDSAIESELQDLLIQKLAKLYPESEINFAIIDVQQQCYNNCGPELIENFIWYLTGHRATQEDAVYVHSQLKAQALLNNRSEEVIKQQITIKTQSGEYKTLVLYKDTNSNQTISTEIQQENRPTLYLNTISSEFNALIKAIFEFPTQVNWLIQQTTGLLQKLLDRDNIFMIDFLRGILEDLEQGSNAIPFLPPRKEPDFSPEDFDGGGDGFGSGNNSRGNNFGIDVGLSGQTNSSNYSESNPFNDTI